MPSNRAPVSPAFKEEKPPPPLLSNKSPPPPLPLLPFLPAPIEGTCLPLPPSAPGGMFGPVDGEAQGRNGDPLQHRVPPPTPLPGREIYTTAVLLATVSPPPPPKCEQWRTLMELLSER